MSMFGLAGDEAEMRGDRAISDNNCKLCMFRRTRRLWDTANGLKIFVTLRKKPSNVEETQFPFSRFAHSLDVLYFIDTSRMSGPLHNFKC